MLCFLQFSGPGFVVQQHEQHQQKQQQQQEKKKQQNQKQQPSSSSRSTGAKGGKGAAGVVEKLLKVSVESCAAWTIARSLMLWVHARSCCEHVKGKNTTFTHDV